jgi:hypothetical protein
MTIALNTTLRNNRADQITSFTGTSAKLRIYTTSYTTQLVECICNATAFAPAATGGVLVLNSITAGVATGAGTAALARIYKSDGTTVVIEGLTVGISASNINITNTTVGIGDAITVTSATITEGNA